MKTSFPAHFHSVKILEFFFTAYKKLWAHCWNLSQRALLLCRHNPSTWQLPIKQSDFEQVCLWQAMFKGRSKRSSFILKNRHLLATELWTRQKCCIYTSAEWVHSARMSLLGRKYVWQAWVSSDWRTSIWGCNVFINHNSSFWSANACMQHYELSTEMWGTHSSWFICTENLSLIFKTMKHFIKAKPQPIWLHFLFTLDEWTIGHQHSLNSSV